MSLVGSDIGEEYYKIAKINIDKCLDSGNFKLNDYVGYGLGDYTLPEEKDLFENNIQKLPKKEKIICILSKAM